MLTEVQRVMGIFKNIMLSIQLTGCVNSMALGMKYDVVLEENFESRDVRIVEGMLGTLEGNSINAYWKDWFVALPYANLDQIQRIIAAIPLDQRYTFFMPRSALGYSLDLDENTVLTLVLKNHSNATDIVEVVRILLEAMPEDKRAEFVMAKDNQNYTALHHLALNQEIAAPEIQIAIARMLIKAIPKEQRSAFVMARCKFKIIIPYLLQYTVEYGYIASQFAKGELANFLRKYETSSCECFF